MSLSLQTIRWILIFLGGLFLAAATWLYPTSSVDSWSDSQWKRSLAGTSWTFSRLDHSVISDQLVLSAFGTVNGYAHPNEHAWTVRDKYLEFLSASGQVTSTFPLGGSAPLAGMKLTSVGDGHHQLGMNSDRHGLVLFITLTAAVIGLSMLVAARYVHSPVWLVAARYVHSPVLRAFPAPLARWLRSPDPAAASGPANSSLSWINGKYCALGLLASWFLLATVMATMPAYLPDEAWFFYEALRSSEAVRQDGAWMREVIAHHNAFGYGGLWWSIYTCITMAWVAIMDFFAIHGAATVLAVVPEVGKVMLWEHASPAIVAPMVMMRILSLSSLAFFGMSLVRASRTGAGAVLAILVLATMPLAWWAGKMASPELFATALFAVAVVRWFHTGRTLPALLIASFAVGIKLTIAPIYIVFVGFVWWNFRRQPEFTLRLSIRYMGFCILTILLCNIWIFHDAKAGIEQLLSLSRSYAPHPDPQVQSDLILWMSPEFWEGGNYGSLAYWAGGISIPAAALLIAGFVNRRLACFLLIGGVAQYGFMMSQPPHAWYWFPVILSAIIPFCMLGRKGAVCTGLVLAACVYPFGNTLHELSYKRLHVRELDQVRAQRSCVETKLTQIQPDVVYDMAAIGTFMADAGQHTWHATNYHDSFLAMMTNRMQPGEKQLLLLGERSERNFPQLRARATMPDRLVGQCGGIKLIDVGA